MIMSSIYKGNGSLDITMSRFHCSHCWVMLLQPQWRFLTFIWPLRTSRPYGNRVNTGAAQPGLYCTMKGRRGEIAKGLEGEEEAVGLTKRKEIWECKEN